MLLVASIIDLGVLPGWASATPLEVNEKGQVVGFLIDATDSQFTHPFLYSDGVMTDIGALPGGDGSVAVGINDRGQVVGHTYYQSRQSYHSFLYDHGMMTDLGLVDGWSTTFAMDINNRGQVAGYFTGNSDDRVFLWQDGVFDTMGVLSGDFFARANALNDAGQVVGSSGGWGGNRAVLFDEGSITILNTDMATGRFNSYAEDINSSGVVVGQGSPGGAFLWTPTTRNGAIGTKSDLPPLNGSVGVLKINDSGQVTGSVFDFMSPPRPFLYSDGQVIEPNSLLPPDSGWTIRNLNGINNLGQIIGSGLHDGALSGFLLTPEGAGVDLLPTSFERDEIRGGVNFSYRVRGVTPPSDPTAALFWARGTSLADAIGGPITSIPVEGEIGDRGPIHVSSAVLGSRPAGTTHLLLVMDPTREIAENVEGNNILALALEGSGASPVVNVGPDGSLIVGQTLSRVGSFTDPSDFDSWTATVDYGDGTGLRPLALNPDNSFAPVHTYARPGQFRVMVTVRDVDGGTGLGVLTLAVSPAVAPPSGYGPGPDAFVTALYQEQLNRGPEPVGLRYWAGRVAIGDHPRRVATSIWNSPEHRALRRRHLAAPIGLRRSYHDARRAWRLADPSRGPLPAGPLGPA